MKPNNMKDPILEEKNIHLQNLYHRIQKMKKERKDAQFNVEFLRNRLNLLNREEEKVMKKISNTQAKRQNKLKYYREQDEFQREKDYHNRQSSIDLLEKKKSVSSLKNGLRGKIIQNKEESIRKASMEQQRMKEQRKYNEELANHIKEEEVLRNKNKQIIRKVEIEIAEERKKYLNAEKRNKIKEDLKFKIMLEAEEYSKYEEEMLKCEQAGEKIFSKISSIQSAHKEMCAMFEKLGIS